MKVYVFLKEGNSAGAAVDYYQGKVRIQLLNVEPSVLEVSELQKHGGNYLTSTGEQAYFGDTSLRKLGQRALWKAVRFELWDKAPILVPQRSA